MVIATEIEDYSIREAYVKGDYLQVIFLGKLKATSNFDSKNLNYLASAYAQLGRFNEAINSLRKLLVFSQNPTPIKLNLAQLLLKIGEYDEAKSLISDIIEEGKTKEKTIAKAILGNIYSKKGKYAQAVKFYSDSLINSDLKSRFFVLQNLSMTQKLWIKKLKQESFWSSSFEPELSNRLLNQANLLDNQRRSNVEELLQLSANLPKSQTLAVRIASRVEGDANFNKLDLLSEVKQLPDSITKGEFLIQLKQPLLAIKVAQKLEDPRLLSFALGAAANFYKTEGNLSKALHFFLKAQQAASQVGALDSLYLWQWELAKLYRDSNQFEKADQAFNDALQSLLILRTELAANYQNFVFSNNIQSLYLEALEFFVEQSPSPENLINIKRVSRQYQITLIESYFNSPCNISLKTFNLAEGQAFIYFISLPKETYILLELPQNKLRLFSLNLSKQELRQLAISWRRELKNFISDSYRPLANQLYTKLISPIEQILLDADINTLLIRPDGALQNLPLSALLDNNDKFLLQKFEVIYSIGLEPQNSFSINKSFGSIFGLANPPSPLSPLPGVEEEVATISRLTNSIAFLNENFTYNKFVTLVTKQKQSFLHLATHGKFGGNAEQSWLQAFDQKIFLPQLEAILLSSSFPINLLVLSGCETAVGNDRTLLGMSGLAIRTRVQFVISTLWKIEDRESSALIADFYDNYQKGDNPSKALRQAQIKAIKGNSHHPYFWSSYTLISH
ncbi:MAG: CHAT domain-containing protein [Crocosphaera sp.]